METENKKCCVLPHRPRIRIVVPTAKQWEYILLAIHSGVCERDDAYTSLRKAAKCQ